MSLAVVFLPEVVVGGEDWKREAILDAKWGGSDVGCGSGVGTRVFGEKNHALWIGLERTP